LPIDEFLRRFLLHLLPAASCASATSASSPIGDALPCYRSVLAYSRVQQRAPLRQHPQQNILTHSGTARSAAEPCMSSNGSPRLNCCFAPRLSTSTPHEPTTPSSNHPRASARTETLCLTRLGLLCQSSLPPLPTTPTRLLSRRALVRAAAHSRQEQRSKPSAHAQTHTNPIGSRTGRLPSSRCIRSAPNTPSINELGAAGRSRYSPKTFQALWIMSGSLAIYPERIGVSFPTARRLSRG
jgi:hypothetical protein